MRIGRTRRRVAIGLGCLPAITLAIADPVDSTTASLLNLPVCSTARLISDVADRVPECVPDRQRRRISIRLTAQTSEVLVGGYRVRTDNYNGCYIAPVLEARPGDELRIRLRDRLEPDTPTFPIVIATGTTGPVILDTVASSQTNLHTHGLIVHPQNSSGVRGYGDDPYLRLDSRCRDTGPCLPGTLLYRILIPLRLPPDVYGNQANAPHPSGLFWYHPHIHGLAQHQVSGGMAGLISVGDPREAILDDDTPIPHRIDVRYIALKDLQVETTVKPEDVASSNRPVAVWQGAKFDSQFCGALQPGNTPSALFGPGYCRPGAQTDYPNRLWLFTVNGQRYPEIRVPAERAQLWRIANLSSSVTYELHLTDVASHQDVPLKIVGVDGVAAGIPETGSHASNRMHLIERTSVLLMPAARVEILIENWAPHTLPRTLILRTAGVHTGATVDSGDDWPPIRLAEVHLDSARGEAQPSLGIRRVPELEEQPAFSALGASTSARSMRTVDAKAMPVCAHRLASNERRRVTFVSYQGEYEALELGASVLDSHDKVIVVLPARTMPHMIDFAKDDHFCSVLGAQEVWELRNDTQELHNFHIHQVKFRLATAAEIAAVAKRAAATTYALQLPSTLPAQSQKLLPAEEESLAVWHDTYPVAPGQSVFIHIAFTAPEQVGRYVFHCHILEHEDKGMMAPFEVLRP